MSSYYQIIDVVPSANQAEIERALDKQYNQCRRLVTHHDPNVVSQATQALQLLENIRAILMDPGRRAAYDASIGISSGDKFGGLADPSSAPSSPSSPVAAQPFGMLFGKQPPARPPAAPAQVLRSVSPETQAWTCPKCKLTNVVNSLFCKGCGEVLASPCPSCESLVVRGAQFCSKCGVSIEQAQRKKEMDTRLVQLRSNLDMTVRFAPQPEANVKDLGRLVVRDACWALVSLMVGLLSWQAANGVFGINLAGFLPIGNHEFGYPMAQALPLFAGLAVMGGLFVLLSVIHRVFPLVTAIGAGMAMIFFMTLPATVNGFFQLMGAPMIGSYIAGWIVTVLFFPIMISRIFAATQYSVTSLKDFYKWIPNLGCLGFLFWLVFCMLPILYAFYIFFASTGMTDLIFQVMNEYEGLLLLANGLLFSSSALLLVFYVLLVWRTSLGVETRFKQALAERAENTSRLSEQIKTLEQGIAGLNLRPR